MPPSPANEAGKKRLTELVMPKLGLTMTEGVLADWRVEPGEHVRAGQVIFVVETDKIANEIEAPSDGEFVEILVNSGETVPVGTPLARWTGTGLASDHDNGDLPTGAAADVPVASEQPAPRTMETGRNGTDDGRVKATPLARRIARRNRINIASIAGSGPGGRIKAADVEKTMAAGGVSSVAAAPASRPTIAMERITPSPKHQAMARRVVAAKRDIPHFYVTRTAEVTALAALRREMNAIGGPKFTVTHFLLKAVGLAMQAHSEANRLWDSEELLALPGTDVGLVVNTDEGLFIPVMRDVGGKAMDRLALEADALVERARGGRLGRDDLDGGAISVSNLGMAGVASLAPIINPPQSAILGVGAAAEIFRPDSNGAPVLRREVTLTLACDHRVYDGMLAARVLDSVVRAIEAPHSLLLTINSSQGSA